MGHKSSHGPSAGLDSSGVKNGSGVQRGVSSGIRRTAVPDWTLLESKEVSGGIRWTGPLSRNIQHTYRVYIWWTVPDWTLLESKEMCPVESARLSWSLPDRTTRMRLESTGIRRNE